MEVETVVRERYAEGAEACQQSLCCPVSYNRELIELLPPEIIEKDYGCGDPSRYVRPGDAVLDLGSGGGKIAYMAASITGAQGQVHGIDMTGEMLELARRYQGQMAETLGYDIVQFHKGLIQDAASILPRASIDLVISNCVLNLVAEQDRLQLINGIFSVLRPGGRVAIADIVCDQEVPEAMKDDAELWSGCISGAFQKQAFLDAFSAAGFEDVRYDNWDDQPWQEVQGLAFHSATVCARKPGGERAADEQSSACCS